MCDDRITEADLDEDYGQVHYCEAGYEGCEGGDYTGFMFFVDNSWLCSHCYRTAEAEAEDYDRMRAGY